MADAEKILIEALPDRKKHGLEGFHMQRKFLILAIVILAALLGWMTLFWSPQLSQQQRQDTLGQAAAPTGGDFTLHSYRGPVKLRDFRSQVVLLYFGYTWCPDICPTNLGMISLALDAFSEAEQAGIQVLFISVDPQRDNLERLKEYGEYFHPKILGITGSPDTLADLATRYGASYRRVGQPSDTDYVVDHSANTYLIDKQGRLAEVLPHATSPETLVPLIRRYLEE